MPVLWNDFIQNITLEQNPQPLLENAIYPLHHQAFLVIEGSDAAKFLQGQLSCDINQLSQTHSGIGSHSNPKGRMLSSFRICQIGDDEFLLRLHASIIENAEKALAKYIVFSKATIRQEKQYVGFGLHGTMALEKLQAVFADIPLNDGGQVLTNDGILICTSSELKSYEFYASTEQAAMLWSKLDSHLQTTNDSQHRLIQQHLGLAFVEENTFDSFIPQMFNYQFTPAISFKKGCYTGQEIIARMQYLGKLKRHCYHYHIQTEGNLVVGEELYLDNATQSVGHILSAVKVSDCDWEALLVLTDAAEQAQHLNTAITRLALLQRKHLPYDITK